MTKLFIKLTPGHEIDILMKQVIQEPHQKTLKKLGKKFQRPKCTIARA